MDVWASERRNAWSTCFLLEDTRRMIAVQWMFGRARGGMLGVLAFCLDYSLCLLAWLQTRTDACNYDSMPIASTDAERGRPRGSCPEGSPKA